VRITSVVTAGLDIYVTALTQMRSRSARLWLLIFPSHDCSFSPRTLIPPSAPSPCKREWKPPWFSDWSTLKVL